jgi:predicted glycoside hydrolase/deacetylase ChbG (UPF0249 family)
MSISRHKVGFAPAHGETDGAALTRLIVHADDFGETVEITRGICTAIEAGAVTSTTIMANMTGTEDALARVPALADRASFGVHLNLCEGRPLTSGGTLVDEQGDFHRKRALFLRSLGGALSMAEVEAELTAQIARVHDAGIRISHVDGHKHLHQLPVIAAAVAHVLPRFGIERVRVTRLRTMRALGKPATLMREVLAVRAAAVFHRANLRSPHRVADLQWVMAVDADADKGAALRELRGPVELFCHPGTPQADIDKPGSCVRHSELQFLLSTRFQELLVRHRLRLANYWEV